MLDGDEGDEALAQDAAARLHGRAHLAHHKPRPLVELRLRLVELGGDGVALGRLLLERLVRPPLVRLKVGLVALVLGNARVELLPLLNVRADRLEQLAVHHLAEEREVLAVHEPLQRDEIGRDGLERRVRGDRRVKGLGEARARVTHRVHLLNVRIRAFVERAQLLVLEGVRRKLGNRRLLRMCREAGDLERGLLDAIFHVERTRE
mmetsp:Transcript_9282/g.29285  ORF Transcript_9282/g.29285 Transcript_9282/m.29285 type:complete len:206 (-) Transcript_9282:107-724(-)